MDKGGRLVADKLAGRRGELFLQIQWVHSLEVAGAKSTKPAKGRKMSVEGEGLFDNMQEQQEVRGVGPRGGALVGRRSVQEEARPLTVRVACYVQTLQDDEMDVKEMLAAKEEEDKRQAERLKRMEEVELKKGDYQIQVRRPCRPKHHHHHHHGHHNNNSDNNNDNTYQPTVHSRFPRPPSGAHHRGSGPEGRGFAGHQRPGGVRGDLRPEAAHQGAASRGVFTPPRSAAPGHLRLRVAPHVSCFCRSRKA